MQTMTTTQAKDLFLRALTGNNYSERTIKAYSDDLTQFLSWLQSCRTDWDIPTRFTRIDLVEFMNHQAALKTTGVTRNRKLSSLRKFFSFLKENDIIAGNPAETVKGPRKEEHEPVVLQKTEYQSLLYAASGNSRDYAIIQVFLQAGLRVSELANLTLSDLDLVNKTLLVQQGKGKKDRTIPLEQQSLAALKSYLGEREADPECEHLFVAKNGTSLAIRSVRYIVKKHMQKAGIKKRASVHTLRHTFGTHKVDKGMTIPNLQDLMGHRKMETTYRYVHLAKTNLRQQQEQTAL